METSSFDVVKRHLRVVELGTLEEMTRFALERARTPREAAALKGMLAEVEQLLDRSRSA